MHLPLYREMYDDERLRLKAFLRSIIGRPYDSREAKESGGLCGLLTWMASKLRVRHSSAYFCVEGTAEAYARLGIWPTDDPAKWNPNRWIRALRKREILLQPERLT